MSNFKSFLFLNTLLPLFSVTFASNAIPVGTKVCTIDVHNYVQCNIPYQNFISNFNLQCNGNAIAWAKYEDNINSTGFAQLEITTNPDMADSLQAYAAGYLEGLLTRRLIEAHWSNVLDETCLTSDCDKINKFVKNNTEYVKRMTEVKKLGESDSYWHQVELIYKQIDGMQDGYDKVTKQGKLEVNMFWMSLVPELYDLSVLFDDSVLDPNAGHCSAIIKPLADGSDLYVAHNTWVVYQTMLRIIKKYNFGYHKTSSPCSDLVPAQAISFSSYPGAVWSLDDYYITSAKLVVLETTIYHHNKSAMQMFIKPENTVFTFIRVMVANRLASNGKEWTEIFVRQDSGTYTDQFMIVDYNKFVPGRSVEQLASGLLWIVESFPGMTHAGDVTSVVRNQGYWASYNSPYFKDINQVSGYAELERTLGIYYNNDLTARAQIFRREHIKVKDMKSFYLLERYNDFKNDPLSLCCTYNLTCNPPYSPLLALAARKDLADRNGYYQVSYMGFGMEGATDVKMTNNELVKKLKMLVEIGPTSVQQPVFSWSTVNQSTRHVLQPDMFKFPTIQVNWLPEKSNIVKLI